MIVDCHAHAVGPGQWPPEWFDWVALDWANRQSPAGDPEAIRSKIEGGVTDLDGSQLLEDMREAGVDRSVLLAWDWGPDFSGPQPSSINSYNADLVTRSADQLVAFAALDPRRPDAAETLTEAIGRFRAKGLKLYPPAGFYPSDRTVFPLYEICEAYGIPVAFHTGMSLPLLATRYGDPLHVQDVQANFPRLVIWLAHAGARLWWDEALFVASQGIYTHLELSAWLWDDTTATELDEFTRRVCAARDRLGPDRLLFGSDHVSGRRVRGRKFLPTIVGLFQDIPRRARRLGLSFSETELDLLMGGNAVRTLRLG